MTYLPICRSAGEKSEENSHLKKGKVSSGKLCEHLKSRVSVDKSPSISAGARYEHPLVTPFATFFKELVAPNHDDFLIYSRRDCFEKRSSLFCFRILFAVPLKSHSFICQQSTPHDCLLRSVIDKRLWRIKNFKSLLSESGCTMHEV